jgi:hypothetical protein
MSQISVPLYAETLQFLQTMDALDESRLCSLVAEGFSAVDIGVNGEPVIINELDKWLWYTKHQFAILDVMGATQQSDVLAYSGKKADSLAHSVIRFQRKFTIRNQRLKHICVATLIWQCTPTGWKLLRWHCTLEEKETTTL